MSLGRSSLDPKRVLTLHCSYCNLLTLSVSKLLEHLMTAHNDVSCDCCLYQCCHCSIISTDENLLKEHAAVWHPDVTVSIKCISQTKINANLSADSPTTTTNPMILHDNMPNKPSVACQLCGFPSKTEEQLKLHYANAHNINIHQQIFNNRPANQVDSTIFTDDPLRHRTAPLPAPNFLQQISTAPLNFAASAILSANTSSSSSAAPADSSRIVIDLVNDNETRLKSFNSDSSSKLATVSNPLKNLSSFSSNFSNAVKRISNFSNTATTSQNFPECGDVDVSHLPTTNHHQPTVSSVTDDQHTELYVCSNCGNGYNKRKYYYEHVFCCGRVNPFQCVCGRVSKWRSNFYAHRKRCSIYIKSRLKNDSFQMSASSSSSNITYSPYITTATHSTTGIETEEDRENSILSNNRQPQDWSKVTQMTSALLDVKNDVLISDDTTYDKIAS